MYKKQNNGATPKEKIYLGDGTELRLCVGAVARQGIARLYCSRMGIFFSLSSRGLNPVKCRYIKNFRPKPNVHSYYPRMCGFKGAPYCHLLVAIAWIGPRPEGYECHHRNGDMYDNSASNLVWLSHDDHRRYDAELRKLKIKN